MGNLWIKRSEIAALLVFGSLSVGTLAHAAEPARLAPGKSWESGHPDTWEPPERPSPAPKRRWEIAPETYWFFYREPSLEVDWKGMMYGIRISYTEHNPKNHLMGSLEGHYALGHVDYDGFLSDNTPFTDEGLDHFFEIRGKAGYDLREDKIVTTPFTGLGYRYWFDNLESSSAYRRHVRYLYSPIGIELTYAVSDTWTWKMGAEYDVFWRGWVTSQLSDVNPGFNDVQNAQDSGYGLRGSVSVQHVVNQALSISIEPFIRYWNIDNSNKAPITFSGALIGTGQEPSNKTIESGLKISFIF